MKGGPFALFFRWSDLALLISVKSGFFSVKSVVWRKKGHCKSRAFLLYKKRRLKKDTFQIQLFDTERSILEKTPLIGKIVRALKMKM